jgi:hypothetical protein
MSPELPAGLEPRVRRLTFIGGRTAAQIHRELKAGADGEEPLRVSYQTIARMVRDLRLAPIDPPSELTPSSMAGRIMRLLDRQLARIEEDLTSVDVEQLDRIARTLRTIEPIRPKGEGRERSSLRSLLHQEVEESSEAPSSRTASEAPRSAETAPESESR